jgi:hypothetical protein
MLLAIISVCRDARFTSVLPELESGRLEQQLATAAREWKRFQYVDTPTNRTVESTGMAAGGGDATITYATGAADASRAVENIKAYAVVARGTVQI